MKTWIIKRFTKKWLRRYAKRELVPSVRAVFIGDAVSTEVILHGQYDSEILDFYSNRLFPTLSQTSTALDIGANIGNHSSVFAKYFSHVIAFEPNPQTALLLRANSLGKSIDVVEKGLSDVRGELNFRTRYSNIGGSGIVEKETDTTIEVETLDRLSRQFDLGDVSFIKIDVEGHEARVLAGAQDLLRRLHPVIAVEMHSSVVPDVAELVEKEIQKAGYKYLYAIVPDPQGSKVGGLIAKCPRRWIPKIVRTTREGVSLKPIRSISDEFEHLVVSSKPITL